MSAPDFSHRGGEHCGSACLRDLLAHHQLSWGAESLDESLVFGLSGGLAFLYAELPGAPLPVYLQGRSDGLERDLCRHLGIGLDLRLTDDPELGWQWLRNALDEGQPTMIWADIAHLDYLSVRLSNARHDVVAVTHDPDQGIVWLADHAFDELQPCSYASLARARSSVGFPEPTRHATWLMDFPPALPAPQVAIRLGLDRAVSNMRQDAPADAPFSTGLAGLERFVERLRTWPEIFGQTGLAPALQSLRIFVSSAGTGGALFRSLHARFLSQAAELSPSAALTDCARHYGALADDWVQLAAGARRREPQESLGACAEIADRILVAEREGLLLMEAAHA